MPGDKTKLAGTAAAGDNKGSFRIRRYEPQFQGWVYTKDLTFKLEFAFQDLQNGAVAAGGAINDAYFNYDFTKGKKLFRIQLGQFKVPFGRQELTTSFALQLVDRALTAGEYERGRDQGVQLDGATTGSKFTYAVGVFNGNGRSFTANDNSKFQFDTRVQFQPFGDLRYSEADFESRDKPLIGFAAQYDQNDYANTVTTAPPGACPCAAGNFKRQIWGGDVAFKFKGIYLMAEYFDRKITPHGSATAVEFKSNGYNLEGGYLIGGPVKGKWEIAGRYATFDPTKKVGDNDRSETAIGLNWFYNKHFAKIQADYRWLKNKATDVTDKELRIQTQLYF
jgi:phosphate-selective porin OprO/OprP